MFKKFIYPNKSPKSMNAAHLALNRKLLPFCPVFIILEAGDNLRPTSFHSSSKKSETNRGIFSLIEMV